MRYSLQELNNSGFTYYEIIDTENNCSTLFTSTNYTQIYNFMKWLERNKDMVIIYDGKEL